MSIDTNCALVIGLPKNELDENLVEEALDNDDVESFPYYYDCCEEDMLIGFSITSTSSYAQIKHIKPNKDLVEEFKKLFNKKPNLYITVLQY